MVKNAVNEMRRYYSRKVIDVLIRVTRHSLDMLRRRFASDLEMLGREFEKIKKVFFAVEKIIPNTTNSTFFPRVLTTRSQRSYGILIWGTL